MGQTDRRLIVVGAVLLASALASMGGCRINFGSGGSTGNLNLGIPYRSQPSLLSCGPTAVLMWRLYDGLSEIPPNDLLLAMGCSMGGGCSVEQIRDGVNSYTATHDTFIDDFGGVGDPDILRAQFHSRQLSSLAFGTPAIVTIEGNLHTMVPNKGNYSTAPDGLRRWDYVYAHDPWAPAGSGGKPNQYFTVGSWMDLAVFQIVSGYAVGGWQVNYSQYGHMHVRGRPGGPFYPDM